MDFVCSGTEVDVVADEDDATVFDAWCFAVAVVDVTGFFDDDAWDDVGPLVVIGGDGRGVGRTGRFFHSVISIS